VLNLLPIPVLDGGHIFFLCIEAVKGSPVSIKKLEVAQQIGLALLLMLMVFVIYNDITRFLPK
jgi:regulator of sigma E protease